MSDLTPNMMEREALDHLLQYLDIINNWEITANALELIPAIHVLQHFVIQHMLHRVDPKEWGEWYRHYRFNDETGTIE